MKRWIAAGKRVYGHLPHGARTLAASAFGYYLRLHRYGPETDRMVSEALERDAWSEDQWREWHDARLRRLLVGAASRVPHYREYWAAQRHLGGHEDLERLSNWPVLEKDSLRRTPEAFLAEDARRTDMLELHTSGTTGAPIHVWRNRATDRAWYALVEARLRHWYGVSRHVPWAIVGGRMVVPFAQRRPPYWVWNAGLNQLYLSGAHIGRDTVAAYLDAIDKHGVAFIVGYPSSLYALAWMALENGLTAPRMRVVVSNAEPLLPHHREAIGQLFGCPVRDTYGMVELVAAASECEHGVMHLWPDVGIVEVVDEGGAAVPPGTIGELILTGLLNADMPLIRYRLGDRGAIAAPSDVPCACGRRLPILHQIDGRTRDNLVAADGRRIFSWGNVVFDGLAIRERQVVQHSVDEIDVYIVPAGDIGQSAERLIKQRMRELLGDVAVTVQLVDAIPRGPNGKLQTVVSHVAQR